MSRLKQDKLSHMLAAADAAKQAAEQRSRRLEIKFARSDKGHALMQSAKLQAGATELEKQVTHLQEDVRHKVQWLPGHCHCSYCEERSHMCEQCFARLNPPSFCAAAAALSGHIACVLPWSCQPPSQGMQSPL